MRVNKPRLRRKGRGAGKEVPVPAYEALQKETATSDRMLQILLNGVSTRRYQRVIPANPVGIAGECRREDLQRNITPESRVASAIHFSHATRADRCKNFVGSQTRASG